MGWTKRQVTQLRERMREQGRSDDDIADEIRYRCGCSRLAAYRRLHGWSQAEAADRYREHSSGLTLDQATLSRLELWPQTGGRSPQSAQVIALASLYGTSPLRLLCPEGLEKLDPSERDVLLRVNFTEDATTESPSPRTVEMKHRVPGDFVTPERQVEMAAQRALRFGSIAEGGNVGPETIQQLFEEVERLCSLYPRVPLSQILGDLVEAQNVVFTLLEGRQRPNQTRDLYLLSGILGFMLAKASHDLGNPRSAMKQARTAYICADNAEHDGLRLRIRTQQSLTAYWAGWNAEAARYAELAQKIPTRNSGSAAVWLAAQSARTWASLGDRERALTELSSAITHRDQAQESDLDSLGGLMRFADCRRLYYEAETQVWLPGQESEVEQAALAAIQAYEEAAENNSNDWAYGDEAGARADLSFARVSQGEVEGAYEALAPVLGLPVEQRTAGIVASVMRVHGALRQAQYNGHGAVSQMRREIEAYSQHSVASLTTGR